MEAYTTNPPKPRYIKVENIIINTDQITTARYIEDERYGNKWFIRLSDGDSYYFNSNPETDRTFGNLFIETADIELDFRKVGE